MPFIFVLRRNLEEAQEFNTRRHRLSMGGVFSTLLQNWGVIVTGMMLVVMTTANFYLITVYALALGKTALHLNMADSLLVALCVGVPNFVQLPIGGALSDRISRRPLLIGMTVLTIATVYPALSLLALAPSFMNMLLVLPQLSFMYGIYSGTTVAALTEVMPMQMRVAGLSLAYSLAVAVFNGFTPVISTAVIHMTGGKAAPGHQMDFAAARTLMAMLALYRRHALTLVPTH